MTADKADRAAVVLRWERGLGLCVRTYLPGGVMADVPVSWWRALPTWGAGDPLGASGPSLGGDSAMKEPRTLGRIRGSAEVKHGNAGTRPTDATGESPLLTRCFRP